MLIIHRPRVNSVQEDFRAGAVSLMLGNVSQKSYLPTGRQEVPFNPTAKTWSTGFTGLELDSSKLKEHRLYKVY